MADVHLTLTFQLIAALLIPFLVSNCFRLFLFYFFGKLFSLFQLRSLGCCPSVVLGKKTNKRRAVYGLNISFKPNKAFHILCLITLLVYLIAISRPIQKLAGVLSFERKRKWAHSSVIIVSYQLACMLCIVYTSKYMVILLYYSHAAAITKSLADFLFSFYISDFGRIYLYLYQSCIYILCAAHGSGCLWMGISYKSTFI
jgi:hypothetical protein